jgi:hypothetical protein
MLVEPVFHQNRSIIARRAQVATVLYRAYPVRPPEPTTHKQQFHDPPSWARRCIVVSVAIGLLAASNLFRTIDPWHGSIVLRKNIRPKTSSGNDGSTIFSAKWQHWHFLVRHAGEENAGNSFDLGGIFVCGAPPFSNLRTAMRFEYSKKRQTKISYRFKAISAMMGSSVIVEIVLIR